MSTELSGKKTTNWQEKFSKRAKKARRSAIRELLEVADIAEVISFAGGLPATKTLPVEELKQAAIHFYKENLRYVLQYSRTEGVSSLREHLSGNMSQYGIDAEVENILPTSGSQQALDLLGRLFLDPGDVVISSAPTYTGAIQAFDFYDPEFKTVELDENGMRIDQVEALLAKHDVKFIYVLPNFHNPGGVTLSGERRDRLVEIAAEYGTPLVEDDPYGELRFEGDDIEPILPRAPQNVIYLSTFSKTLAPGFRLGWVTAPPKPIEGLVKMKQGADLCTSALVQHVALYMCEKEGFFKNQVEGIQKLYGRRRDVMLEAMDQYFPDEVEWTHPEGGLFLWVSLPEGYDTGELFDIALEKYGVAFVYGSAFLPNQESSSSMRLNFSYMNTTKIEEGIEKLGNAIDNFL